MDPGLTGVPARTVIWLEFASAVSEVTHSKLLLRTTRMRSPLFRDVVEYVADEPVCKAEVPPFR